MNHPGCPYLFGFFVFERPHPQEGKEKKTEKRKKRKRKRGALASTSPSPPLLSPLRLLFLPPPPPGEQRRPSLYGQLFLTRTPRWRVFVDHQSNQPSPAHNLGIPRPPVTGTKVDPPAHWAHRECWMGTPPPHGGETPTQRPPDVPAADQVRAPPGKNQTGTRRAAETLVCADGDSHRADDLPPPEDTGPSFGQTRFVFVLLFVPC